MYTGKTTLVITPTISLMLDQAYELNVKGIKAIYLGSAQGDAQAETRAFDELPQSYMLVLSGCLESSPILTMF